ncbi:DHA3 family macrolide efflux protein-like MFS transporter [Kineothrix alysoides]|uniref:DHA3 family macrolide efflux protein-like MFS transporter n=1 Tax=Kineothrix alysoides TaxID=1469948 RepID=A0A4R1QJJ2_9FIRM|nr:MFS transporter [Kineothrix alysoides]TCL53808.1 DHA3 family macrolide efflux protein-like MFS transporter [Kineothrix alysoides]
MTNWKRNATLYIIGQFVSMFASMLVQHSITWQITLETKSGVIMTLFTCAALLPMTLISPFAGVWADRHNRKYLIVISDACIALITLGLAAAYISGYKNIWLMFIVVVARSFGQGIQQPAVSAMIPQIVPTESLQRFNGIQSSIQSLNMFAAPMAAGALLSLLPIEYIFFIDVVTAAIGISIVLIFVKVSGVLRTEEVKRGVKAYFHELREGLRYINSKAWLKLIIIYSTFFGFFASPAALLTPLQTARTFGDDVWRLTAIEIVFSIGAVMGGILISVWGGFKNKAHTIIMACALFGLTGFLLGVVPDFWVYLGVMLICGVTMPLFNTPSMTLLQSKIEPDKMGRVFSVMMMFGGLAMPLGMVVFGPLGDVVRIEWLLIASGIVLFVSGLALLRARSLIEIGKS